MIIQQAASETAERLKSIIFNLQQHPLIDLVILSTEDGIPIDSLNDQDPTAAAVAGFMLSSARQGFAILNVGRQPRDRD